MSIYKVGGSKWQIAPMLSFHPQKLSKLTKTGLRWKLASLCTYMSFEIHHFFHKIFIRSSQSSPIWTEKIFRAFWAKMENIHNFLIHIHNIYIKWKLKLSYIPIWYQKWFFLTKNLLQILTQIRLSAILASNSIKKIFWNVCFLKRKLESQKFYDFPCF